MTDIVMAGNEYKVPKEQWDEWDETQRAVFNVVYTYMKSNQDLFLHPDATKNLEYHWDTTAWNAAWVAAAAVADDRVTVSEDR